MREPKVRRIRETEEEEEVEQAEKLKQFDIKERVGSMRSKLDINQLGGEKEVRRVEKAMAQRF